LGKGEAVIVDCDRHVAVGDYAELFSHMSRSWQKHFERDEFVGSVRDAAAHIRMTDCFGGEVQVGSAAGSDVDLALAIPHQGLTINGWADQVAAKVFIEALNSYAEQNWSNAESDRTAILTSPYDPQWSAETIRARSASSRYAAVSLPLSSTLMGSEVFDPIYSAAVVADLPVVIHFSGVEGLYFGAPSLSGGVHGTAFARSILMPHLAESNIASLCFGGTFEKFPRLRVLFCGFGFAWLPSLLWRLDREWRTFRHDVPWVKRPPSEYVMEHAWLSTWPIGEAVDAWTSGIFTDHLRARVVFGSHDPFDGDTIGDIRAALDSKADVVLGNGAAALGGQVGAVR
jgi:predicted TIM-barrel fold metal-dependent hydrolase